MAALDLIVDGRTSTFTDEAGRCVLSIWMRDKRPTWGLRRR
jgi:hypothetical protein